MPTHPVRDRVKSQLRIHQQGVFVAGPLFADVAEAGCLDYQGQAKPTLAPLPANRSNASGPPQRTIRQGCLPARFRRPDIGPQRGRKSAVFPFSPVVTYPYRLLVNGGSSQYTGDLRKERATQVPVLTIRTKKPSARGAKATVARQVKKKIVSVLERCSDRVLIVYEKEGANIYYEATLPRTPRT